MEVKSIIEMVVTVAMVVIVGFLVIAMVELFVADGGIVWNFFEQTLDAVCSKAQELISSFTAVNLGSGTTPKPAP